MFIKPSAPPPRQEAFFFLIVFVIGPRKKVVLKWCNFSNVLACFYTLFSEF